jgi:hypothetical protein
MQPRVRRYVKYITLFCASSYLIVLQSQQFWTASPHIALKYVHADIINV